MTHYGEMFDSAPVQNNTTQLSMDDFNRPGLPTEYSQVNNSPQNRPDKPDNVRNQQNALEQYGEMLGSYDPDREKLYVAFDNYFNHPTMVKIKDVNGYSMYMSKTYCLLSNECRYIIVFVKQDMMPARTQERLSTLVWESLQTRTLSDQHSLPPHGYQPRKDGPLNVIINRAQVTRDSSTYNCDVYPLTVTLLHGTGGGNQYQPRGNIIAALETYNTIITLK